MKPEFLQTLSQLGILCGIVLTALGGYGAYHFGKKVDRVKEAESDARKEVLLEQIGGLSQGNTDMRNEIKRLVDTNQTLQQQLAPFREIATTLYPQISMDAALGRLVREVDNLRSRADALEQSTTPRRLTPPQSSRLADTLAQYPRRSIRIMTVAGDSEALQFANDLKDAIVDGGWSIDSVKAGFYPNALKGVRIEFASRPAPDEAQWLFEALRSAEVRSGGTLNPSLSSNEIVLVVGSK